MKLETTILPRRDGTVNVEIGDMRYVFSPDDTGALVCDIANEDDVAHLLRQGDHFLPADEEDFAAASALVAAGGSSSVDDDDDDDDQGDPNAAPIEEPASVVAAPPAAPKAGRKKKGA